MAVPGRAVRQVVRPGDDEFPDALDGVEPEMLNKRFLVIDAVAGLDMARDDLAETALRFSTALREE